MEDTLFWACLNLNGRLKEYTEYVLNEYEEYRKIQLEKDRNKLDGNRFEIRKELALQNMRLNLEKPLWISKFIDNTFDDFNNELIYQIELLYPKIYEGKTIERFQITTLLGENGFNIEKVKKSVLESLMA